MSPNASIARLAAAQGGNVTRGQLVRAGLSGSEIETCLRRGTLIRRFRGVFAVGHVPEGHLSRAFAAWLTYGPTSGLSHRDCAAVLGVGPGPSPIVHVSRPAGGRSQTGTRLHQADVAGDLWHREGLRLTSPTRLMLDLAATETTPVVERTYNELQVARLITPPQLTRDLERWDGRRGCRVLRELLLDHGVSRSVLEDAFRALARRLPPHDRNVWVDGVFVDAVWHEQRVVVELDSRGFHSHDRAFEGDRRKSNALQLRGWIVLRFTYRRIKREPDAVIGEVIAALSRSNSRLREQFGGLV